MLKINETILGFDVIDKKFTCDLKKCKGACCIYGDSGAPLTIEETGLLETIYPAVKSFMRAEGIAAIEELGYHVIDKDGDMVTPLVNGLECAYVYFENKIAKCAIEKAYEQKLISFQKPISCHLYPIRITRYKDFDALNFHEWDICKPALALGEKRQTPLYVYLANPLLRKYGEKWYNELKLTAEEVIKFRLDQSISGNDI